MLAEFTFVFVDKNSQGVNMYLPPHSNLCFFLRNSWVQTIQRETIQL